jgi:hypothetical protein
MKSLMFTLLVVSMASAAHAQDDPGTSTVATGTAVDVPGADTPDAVAVDPAGAQAPPMHPAAIQLSHAYEVRAKIHKYASVATLPLFGTQLALGESLYSSSTHGKRMAHAVVGTAIGGLFIANSVTGVWNLVESRKDPNGRTRRLVHGLLMLGADVGFLATSMTAPDHESGGGLATFTANRGTHRTLGITSIGVGTAGYLIMLFGGH